MAQSQGKTYPTVNCIRSYIDIIVSRTNQQLQSVNATRNCRQPYMICKTVQTIIYYYYTQTIVIDFKTYMNCDIQKGLNSFTSICIWKYILC